MKIIFVASDFSGLGKGTFAASLGRVLLSFGVSTKIMKNDLYFNYDAGTINPGEHGEVYVLKDGTEVDQDFGIYERFLNLEHTSTDYMTSGRLFHEIYLRERAGEYLGQTVSIEHIIQELKQKIINFAETCQVGIVELGATVGDIKGVYIIEACRQLINELGPENTSFVLLSYIPYLNNVGELKTMGCQRSVGVLRSKGIKPDIIIARSSECDELPDYQMDKIQLYCEIPKEAVYCFPDLPDYYQIPKRIRSTSLHTYISNKMGIPLKEDKLDDWYENNFSPALPFRVALLGKYAHQDAYISIVNQLKMFGVTSVDFISGPDESLKDYDGSIVPGGWGYRGIEDIISGITICRENHIPCLGICLGLQLMIIEYARNVLGMKNANSLEFDEFTEWPVVTLQEDQKKESGLGGTARLGDWVTNLDLKSRLRKIYGHWSITQRHRHRYEISPHYSYGDFKIVGADSKTKLIEAMELDTHLFYIGVQYHPEFFISRNPIFEGFVEAMKVNSIKN